MDSLLIPAPILLPLAMAFLMPLFEHFSRRMRTLLAILTGVATCGLLLRMAPQVFNGQTLVYWMSDWTPRIGAASRSTAIGISLSIDAWSLLIALVVAGIGTISLFYAALYMRYQTGHGPFYVLMLLLIAALIGFALSGDLFNQFVWLEVFSVAAFALTGFYVEERVAVEGAFKYLITNSIASFFIAIGLALLYMNTGGLNLAQIARDFVPDAGGWVGVTLLIGGYATKAALIPWHFWLPDAHSVAPAPVSAIFSGALIKVGVYAVARCAITLVPLPPVMQFVLLGVALLTILVGGLQMLQQHNPKRVLAFSSVSQMGYVMIGLALGTPAAMTAAMLHIVSHALLKAALFMSAGNIVMQTGLHKLEDGGNLIRKMPLTFGLMSLAALGLSGMPLMSAFISKTLLEEAAIEAGYAGVGIIMIVGSILTFGGLARLIWRLFAPRPLSENQPIADRTQSIHESHPLLLLPIAVLVAGSFFVGLMPNWLAEHAAIPAAEALGNRANYIASVMGEAEMPEVTPHEPTQDHQESVHIPAPFDLKHYGVPLLTILLGSGLAWAMLNPLRWWHIRLLRPVHALLLLLRQWHTGIVGDYALWNAFGTALLLMIVLLAAQRG